MLGTVIGIEVKSGTFTPEGKTQTVPYNNLFIYAIKDNTYQDENNFGFGCVPVTLKIKNETTRITKIFGFVPSMDDLNGMVDSDYDFYFNEKGVLEKIVPVEPPSAAPVEAPVKASAEKKGA